MYQRFVNASINVRNEQSNSLLYITVWTLLRFNQLSFFLLGSKMNITILFLQFPILKDIDYHYLKF